MRGSAEAITFTVLSDGTLLQRADDGSYRPVQDRTDYARLDKLTEDEIERMAASDPDHPALDDALWAQVDEPQPKEAISIKLDRDVLAYFRDQGRGYQTRINAVLRRYVNARRRAG
jgi:uncharacterized protein (DUF4415 family)